MSKSVSFITLEAPVVLADAGFVQRREWMLYKIKPDHSPANISFRIEMDSWSLPLFNEIILRMVERHEILRTTLKVVDGVLKQVISPADEFLPEIILLNPNQSSKQDISEFIRQKVEVYSFLPFNFEFGPLFRILVFERSPGDHQIWFIFHHLIFDQHSIGIFIEESIEISKAVTEGRLPRLPKDIVQYREYTALENALLETEKGDKYRDYWERSLADGLPRLHIINNSSHNEDMARFEQRSREVRARIGQLHMIDERFIGSAIRRYRTEEGGRLIVQYSSEMFRRINVYREEGKNGLLSLFVGSLSLALYGLSGQTKFAFDIPAAKRVSPKFNRTIGWLTGGGPCCLDIGECLSATALLQHVDEQLWLLSKYCIYPYESVYYRNDPPSGSRMGRFFVDRLSFVRPN